MINSIEILKLNRHHLLTRRRPRRMQITGRDQNVFSEPFEEYPEYIGVCFTGSDSAPVRTSLCSGLGTASSCYWDNSTDGKRGREGRELLELKYLNISRQLHCPLGEQDHVLHRLGVRSGHLGSFSSKTATVVRFVLI